MSNLFLFQQPIQDTAFIQSPPVCEFLSLALLFVTLTEPWPGFLQNIPSLGLSGVFLMLRPGLGFGKNAPEVKNSSCHTVSGAT